MRALVWDGVEAKVVERPNPEVRDGWAVVRVTRAGVCRTDLEIVRGYGAFRGTLGHELAGVVEDGPAAWRGRRVVAEINFACGRCASCAAGLGRHCPDRTVMGIAGADGALADRAAVPVANLHAVPDGMGDDEAVFAEPLAAAFEVVEQVPVRPGARVLVLGDGKLGLLVAQVLHAAGARVLAVGRHPAKLGILAARGIETVEAVAWDGAPAEIVVEATGRPEGFAAAVRATRPRGTLVLKSTVAGAPRVDLAPIVVGEITVVGSRCGPFEPALRALATRAIDVRAMIAARVPMARADEALRLAARPGTLKVIVEAG